MGGLCYECLSSYHTQPCTFDFVEGDRPTFQAWMSDKRSGRAKEKRSDATWPAMYPHWTLRSPPMCKVSKHVLSVDTLVRGVVGRSTESKTASAHHDDRTDSARPVIQYIQQSFHGSSIAVTNNAPSAGTRSASLACFVLTLPCCHSDHQRGQHQWRHARWAQRQHRCVLCRH